jgi:hypothetical protein
MPRWSEIASGSAARQDRLSSAAVIMGGFLLCLRQMGLKESDYERMVQIVHSMVYQAHGAEGWDGERFSDDSITAMKAAAKDMNEVVRDL